MEYRLARPEDRARVIEFIDAVFSMSYRPHDFRALLPKVYGDGTAEIPHHIAVNEQGDIRGAVALLPELWRVLDADLWLGYVGSVSVHPRSQGEGHMRALMNMTLDAANKDSLDILVLDGQRQRYGHYGFTPGGWKLTFEVNEKNLKHADNGGYTFLPMDRAEDCDIDFARALYFDQPAYMVRSLSGFVTILKSWNSQPQLIMRDGALAGYLTAKGSAISELCLYEPDVCGDVLKAWMAANRFDEVTVAVGPCERALAEALSAFAENWTLTANRLIKVLHFAHVIEALLRLKAEELRELTDGEAAMWIDGQPLTIRVKDNDVTVEESAPNDAPRMTAMEAQRMLFDPMATILNAAPSDWFPLPFYIADPDAF